MRMISLADVITNLVASGTTMSRTMPERTRQVAVLKTMGVTRKMILTLFVSESVAIAALGGVLGTLFALLLITGGAHSPAGANLFVIAQHEWRFTARTACAVAIIAGFLSSAIPAYGASKTGIVEGLRHIG